MTPASLRFACVFGLLLGAGVAAAAPAPATPVAPVAKSARSQLDAFTRGLKGLDASFTQQVYDPNGRKADASAGSVRLSAPRQFRWEYRQPAPQLIVADGDHIWIYDPELEQVTVRQQSLEEQDSPLSVLIDPTGLDRQYRVTEGGRSGGLDWLVLAPRKADDAPFQKARLGFGAGGLARMELTDGLGQRTVIGFSGWKRNPVFAANTFRFTPPKGVDVVGSVSPSAQVTPLKD
jgi:outer membrane lipoprotein carrier protein